MMQKRILKNGACPLAKKKQIWQAKDSYQPLPLMIQGEVVMVWWIRGGMKKNREKNKFNNILDLVYYL